MYFWSQEESYPEIERQRIPPLVCDLAYISTYILTRLHTNIFGPIIVLECLIFTKPYQREDKKKWDWIYSVSGRLNKEFTGIEAKEKKSVWFHFTFASYSFKPHTQNQSFSKLALLTFCTRYFVLGSLLCGAVLSIVGCLATSLISADMPVEPLHLPQLWQPRCLQTLSNVSSGAKSPTGWESLH